MYKVNSVRGHVLLCSCMYRNIVLLNNVLLSLLHFLFVLSRSAGCILYELAALKRPFDGEKLMDVMYKVTEVDPPPWPAAYSPELATLFTRLFFVTVLWKDKAISVASEGDK